MEKPTPLIPVLAEISQVNDLGTSKWTEVVYWDGKKWASYGSGTFTNGEQVIQWIYSVQALHYKETYKSEFEQTKKVAMSLYNRFYKETAPDFELCDNLFGVLSQIDNMVAGLVNAD